MEQQITSPLDKYLIIAKDLALWNKVIGEQNCLEPVAYSLIVLRDIPDDLYSEPPELEDEDFCYFILLEDDKIYLKNIHNKRVHREVDRESCEDILGYVMLGPKDTFRSVWRMIAEEGNYRFR